MSMNEEIEWKLSGINASSTSEKVTSKDIERKRVSKRLGKFDYKKCSSYQILIELFGAKRSKAELLSVATCLCQDIPELRIDREAQRRKCVLVKWFHDNFSAIKPHLKNYYFADERHVEFRDLINGKYPSDGEEE